VPGRKNLFSYPGDLPWLARGIALVVSQENQIEDVRFLFAPLTMPPLWPPKLKYNAVSAERLIKFSSIVQDENLTILLIKIATLRNCRRSIANGCGYTQGPFWLPWRIALVGRENQIKDIRFFLSPSTTPPVVAAKTRVQRCLCREVDGIWQYRTGGNLTIFDKDHDTAEEGRSQVRQKQSSCSQAYDFATAIWRACVPKRNILFFQGGGSWSCNRL